MSISDRLDQSFQDLSQRRSVTPEEVVEKLEQIKSEEPEFNYTTRDLPGGVTEYFGNGRKAWRVREGKLERTDERFSLNPEWRNS